MKSFVAWHDAIFNRSTRLIGLIRTLPFNDPLQVLEPSVGPRNWPCDDAFCVSS